jgi:F-box protein 9
LYAQAVQAEERGELDKALQLYRRSFKLNPSVDAAYQQSLHHAPVVSTSEGTVKPKVRRYSNHALTSKVLSRDLAAVLSNLDLKTLVFGPEDERKNTPLSTLPDEIIVHILSELMFSGNVTALERFALINRKSRILTLDPSLWRPLVSRTYVPPQIPDAKPLDVLLQDYGADYRRLYIEHPRIRLDGVYIAVCYYARHGQSENAWVSVLHWVTYYRYLRFLPDGTVLSLLTNDERRPADVVHMLQPSLKMKGFYIGTWRLEGTTVIIDDLVDALGTGGILSRYGFSMVLNLKSRPLGRWNKLEMVTYNSVNLETGETDTLPIKQEKPFWFSRVKSYAVT